MLRLSTYVSILFLLLALIFGCDDNPSSSEPTLYSISLSPLPDSICSVQGVTRTLPFTVTAINITENLPIVDESITITLSGNGDISPMQATTDKDGIIEAVYTATMLLGQSSATITAQHGALSDQATINLFGTVRPVNVSLTADPQTVIVQRGASTTIVLSAYISDANGVGVANQPIRFTMRPAEGDSMFGSLSPTYRTANNGIAEAIFHSQTGLGRMIVKCEVDDQYLTPEIYGEVMLEIIPQPVGTGTIQLSSSTDYIYADNGATTARITALMQNQRGEGLPDERITFTTNNNGTIFSSAVTGDNGIAHVELSDIGLPSSNASGDPEPCMVIAQNRRYNTADTVYVDIRPSNNVQLILLSTERQWIRIDGSFWVRATCFTNDEMTRNAPAGTQVQFTLAGESGRYSSTNVNTNEDGVAETQFIAGTEPGIVTLQAEARNQDDLLNPLYSNEIQIEIQPGYPSQLTIEVDPDMLTIGEYGQQSTITATVSDSAGNPVRDGSVLVLFGTSLGTVDPPSTPTTNGIAVGYLRPGVESGLALVTAYVETETGELSADTYVEFITVGSGSIELTADPLVIRIAGCGCNSQSTLRALVRDVYGNPVQIPIKVVFEIITNDTPPEACNINNNTPFNIDTTFTSNGVAVSTLNAGSQYGPQMIRAYTLDDHDQPTEVEDWLNNVQVDVGPPDAIDIDFNNNGIDLGGGAWQIEVSARVYDIYRNPVADMIPVVFNIAEGGNATIEPGFTGNQNMSGESVEGVAFGRMTYNGRHTFEPVTVQAYCRTELVDSVGADETTVLPLQQGTLGLSVDPAFWMFERGEDDSCEIVIWATCQDGHNRLIEEAPILFSSSRGRLYPSENDNGSAAVVLRGREGDFFLDDESTEVIIEINATIEGYDIDAESVNVTMTRR